MQLAKKKMSSKSIKVRSKSFSYSKYQKVNEDVRNIYIYMMWAIKPYDELLFYHRLPPIITEEEMRPLKMQYKPLQVERENMVFHLKHVEKELKDYTVRKRK